MKLNWAEKRVVNNPARVAEQKFEIKWFQKSMPLKPGAVIMEIGCGRGAGARLIFKNFQPVLLIAQDLDIDMIQKAKRYLTAIEINEISLSVADAIHIPVKDRAIDAIFVFGVLHHVPDWQAALLEIERVLKPGGVLYIEELYPSLYQNFLTKRIVLHPKENRFNSQDLHTAMTTAKLTIKHAIEFKKLGILGVAIKLG